MSKIQYARTFNYYFRESNFRNERRSLRGCTVLCPQSVTSVINSSTYLTRASGVTVKDAHPRSHFKRAADQSALFQSP